MDDKKNKISSRDVIYIKKAVQLSIVLLLVTSIVLYTSVYFIYEEIKVKNTVSKTHDYSQQCFDTNFEMVNGIKNILIVGIDDRGGDEPTRADAIIILSIDKNREKLKVVSIMRDTYVNIRDNLSDKINHSYAYGGINLLKKTIEKNYKIDIDNYAVIDFSGFKDIIDSIGGVELDIKEREVKELNRCIMLEIQEDIKLNSKEKKKLMNEAREITQSGLQKLNGYQALAYTRIRKVGNGCYGRTQRQRYVMEALMKKMKDISFLRYPFVAKELFQYIDMDLNLKEIINTAYTVSRIPTESLEQLYIPTVKLSYGTIYRNKGWVLLNDIPANSRVLKNFLFSDQKYSDSDYRAFNVKRSIYWPVKFEKKKKIPENRETFDEMDFFDLNDEIESIFNNNR